MLNWVVVPVTVQTLSKQIGQLKSKGESTDAVMAQVASIKDELEQSAARLDAIQPQMEALLRRPCEGYVPMMDGIESPAEQADVHV